MKKSLKAKVDRLGDLTNTIRALEEEAKALRAEIIDAGVTDADTGRYHVTVSATTKGTLDRGAVVEALGLAWVAAHTKVTTYNVVRVTPSPALAKAA